MSEAIEKAVAWGREGRVAQKRDESIDVLLAILYSSTCVHKQCQNKNWKTQIRR